MAGHIDALFAGMGSHAALVVENRHLAHIAAFVVGQQLIEGLLGGFATFEQGQAAQAEGFVGEDRKSVV